MKNNNPLANTHILVNIKFKYTTSNIYLIAHTLELLHDQIIHFISVIVYSSIYKKRIRPPVCPDIIIHHHQWAYMPLNIVGATVKQLLKFRNNGDNAKNSLLYKLFAVSLSVHLPLVSIQSAAHPSKPEKGQSCTSADDVSCLDKLHHCPAGRRPSAQRLLLCPYACCHLAGHCWDKSCSTTAPLLRLEEGDLAVRRQVPNHFVEPVTETEIEKQVAWSIHWVPGSERVYMEVTKVLLGIRKLKSAGLITDLFFVWLFDLHLRIPAKV